MSRSLNPLEVVYEWLYDDGLGSSNHDCTRSDLTACWGHHDNLLAPLACSACVVGAAFAPTDHAGQPLSYAEVLVETTASPTPVFTWSQEQPYLG